MTSPWRSPSVASNLLSSSAIEPARITLSSGRRAATAATRLATSSSARRSSGPGGSPAPRRTASTVGSSSIVVIASGSAVWGLAATTRQPLRRAASSSGATARSDAAIAARRCGRALWATSRGRSAGRPGPIDAERASQLGVARPGPGQQQPNEGVDIDAGGHGERPDQAPSVANPGNERDRRGGGTQIEGEEGSRVARHPVMLPAIAPRWRSASCQPDRAGRGPAGILTCLSVRSPQGRFRARERAHSKVREGARGDGNAAMGRPSGDRQASQVISSSSSSSRAISCSMPASSARISEAPAKPPPNRPPQDGIEEQHRVRAERPVGPAGLEEVDGRAGQAAQLDLAGDLLDELVTLFLGRLVREAHPMPPLTGAGDAVSETAAPRSAVAARAISKAW